MLINATCTIKRQASGSAADAHGQPTGTYSAVATDVPCSLQPIDANRLRGDRQGIVATHSLFIEVVNLPAGIVPTERDLVTSGGVDYRINGARNYARHIEADLEVVR